MLLSCTSYICLCISVEIYTFRVLEAGMLKSHFSVVEAGIWLLCKSDCFNTEDVWNDLPLVGATEILVSRESSVQWILFNIKTNHHFKIIWLNPTYVSHWLNTEKRKKKRISVFFHLTSCKITYHLFMPFSKSFFLVSKVLFYFCYKVSPFLPILTLRSRVRTRYWSKTRRSKTSHLKILNSGTVQLCVT